MIAADCCPRCGSACEVPGGMCAACLMQMVLAGGVAHADCAAEPFVAENTRQDSAEADHESSDSSESTVSATMPTQLQRIQQYELVEFLGRGGMGTVYKAWDTRLKRHVAIKMISAGEHCHPEELWRFRREAEAVARLQHPSIVQIYEIGESQGLPFLVLEYVAGKSLAARLTGVPWPIADAVDLVATLADAVHVAHLAGVVHRDLKPGNILIADRSDTEPASTRSPEVAPVSRSVRITDFGLAKLAESDRTESGVFMGTPSHCSPEQAAGRTGEIGPASDIFSLGSILYVLLTGQTPFRGHSLVETLHLVMHRDPVPPRTLNPAVPLDVQTICLKSLAKARGDRYATAQALAEDLRRWKAGLPILARHVGPVERGWRWCRRNPVIAGLLTLTVVALLAGTTVSATLAVIAQNRANTIESVNENLVKANDAASKATREAQENARRAEEQSQLALKTLESVIFDIQTKLADVPNAQHVRGNLLKTALAGLENVSAKLRVDPRLDRNTAVATLNLAEVFQQVGRKSGISTQNDANLLYKRATDSFEQLLKADPNNPVAISDLAEACLQYARNLCQTDDSGLTVTAETIAEQKDRPLLLEALTLHRRSITLWRRLVDMSSRDESTSEDVSDKNNATKVSVRLTAAATRYHLARALTEWGYLEVRTGDAAMARDGFREAYDLLNEVLRSDPNSVDYRHMLGTTASRLGDYYLDMVKDGHEQAAPFYQEAMQVLQILAKEHPENHDVQFAYAEAWSRIGDLWAARKQYEKALEAFQKELDITQALEKLAPNNVELMWDSSISYTHVSRELLRLKRYHEAQPILERLVSICAPLVAINPNDRRGQSILLLGRQRLGLALSKTGELDRACATYNEALQELNAYIRRTGDTSFAARIAEIQAELKNTNMDARKWKTSNVNANSDS